MFSIVPALALIAAAVAKAAAVYGVTSAVSRP